MLPEYKNDEYYQGFIGKYFRRKTKEAEYSATKILGFNCETRMFIVENCYASLGGGVIEQNEKYYCFVDADNFEEISACDYIAARYLCES